MKQVTESDKDITAQAYPRYFFRRRTGLNYALIIYPGVQLLSPSVTLTLKALPHAVPQLCFLIFITDTVVSFKDFLVAESIRNESDVFQA